MILWAIDGLKTGTIRFNRTLIQFPLLAAAVYALIQVIPFGQIAETAGISGIPRTISLDPFATQMTALHFFALFIFFAASLVFIDSAERIRKLVGVIAIFGFVYAFFAILQSVLSPGKIYGIYENSVCRSVWVVRKPPQFRSVHGDDGGPSARPRLCRCRHQG